MARFSSVLFLALVISGCTTSYAPDKAAYHPSHPELESASTWTVQGKIGIKSGKGGANLGFVWRQMPDDYEINLTAALGAEVGHLSGSAAGVILTLPGGDIYQGANVNELLDSELGYPIPVLQMRYWIRGMPDPRYKYKIRETGFDQQGWQVFYSKLNSKGPAKIQLEQGTTRVKLVALKWQY